MKLKLAWNVQLFCAVILLAAALACGSGTPSPTSMPPAATNTPTPTVGVEIREVTFAKAIDEDGRPVDPCDEFAPDEEVNLSITLKGRPKEGVMAAEFYLHDEMFAEAELDLANVNSDVIFSIGEDTYVYFWLTPDGSLPISQAYRVDVFYDDEFVDSYPFGVVPPADAIPSQVEEVTLARGVDEDYNPVEPSTTFAPDERVYLVLRGDIGLYTSLKVDWYVDGQLDEEATRSFTAEESASDTGFFFSHVPEEGWSMGKHQAVLTMNDEEVGRYDFTVEEAALVPFEDPAGVFSLRYPADFDQMEKDTTEGYSYIFSPADESGAIYVFFDVLDAPISDDQWDAFVETYSVAGMPGFGEGAVELDRQVGQPGTHFIYLEVESEESNVHGLVWAEEAESVMAIIVLGISIDQWPDRQADIEASLESFAWWPEAAKDVIP